MLALMAAVTHLTRHRWNHSYKEEINCQANDFPHDQMVENCQQEQTLEQATRDLEREAPRQPFPYAFYPGYPSPMQGPVDKTRRVFITFTREDSAIGGQQ